MTYSLRNPPAKEIKQLKDIGAVAIQIFIVGSYVNVKDDPGVCNMFVVGYLSTHGLCSDGANVGSASSHICRHCLQGI
ncbi:hypothetical protein DPMN_137088 [Dreissena polymorpha]|uniref:Uncharacterized protein n=1 Tax=Dreissena polymorpha TaxID=45954 RepID=A0A9D4JEF5_DREPO|nr:hypothetical protein DPMN_137088 [Dreissena polymorpha]